MFVICLDDDKIGNRSDIFIIEREIVDRNSHRHKETILMERFHKGEQPRSISITIYSLNIIYIYLYPFCRPVFYVFLEVVDKAYSLPFNPQYIRKICLSSKRGCIGKSGNGDNPVLVQDLKCIPVDRFICSTSRWIKCKPIWENYIELLNMCYIFFINRVSS